MSVRPLIGCETTPFFNLAPVSAEWYEGLELRGEMQLLNRYLHHCQLAVSIEEND